MNGKITEEWRGVQFHLSGEYAILNERHYKELLASVVDYQREIEKLHKQLEAECSRTKRLIDGIQQLQALLLMADEHAQDVIEHCGIELI